MGLFDWFKRRKQKKQKATTVIAENNDMALAESIADNEDAKANDTEDTCGTDNNAYDEKAQLNPESIPDGALDADAVTVSDTHDESFAADEPTEMTDSEANVDAVSDEPIAVVENSNDHAEDYASALESDVAAAADAHVEVEISKGYTGRFEINRTKDGKKFFFNLYASNKVGIATSQMYSTAQNALNGVRSVITNAPKAFIEDQTLKSYETLPFPKWEIYIDNGGKYRFRLNATNGNCVCHSQGYTSKASCKNGIESIIRSSRNAEIDKAYLIK